MEASNEKNKAENPCDKASILSKIFICWAYPIVAKGYKTTITDEHIYQSRKSHRANILGNSLEQAWQYEVQLKRFSLTRAIWNQSNTEIMFYAFLYVALVSGMKMVQPLLLLQILNFYTDKTSKSETLLYVVALIVALFLQIMSNHCYVLGMQDVGIKARVAVSSLIYRKALKLSKPAWNETSSGHIITLLSKDSKLFQDVMMDLCYFIVAPVEIVVFSFMLYYFLGHTALAGIIFLLVFLPVQMYNSQLSGSYRIKVAQKTDQRILLMNEIIHGIKVIKMYTWEMPFAKLIQTARRLEIDKIRVIAFIDSFLHSYGMYTSRTAQCICILVLVLKGQTPTAQYVFIVATIYNHLSRTLSLKLIEAIHDVFRYQVSCKRLEDFFKLDEKTKSEINDTEKEVNESIIEVSNLSAQWNPTETVLMDINFKTKKNEKVAVIGPVGSGKSSLLNVLLKELPFQNGDLKIAGKISYCSQEPWLFESSIRQNILFEKKMDRKKYNEIIKVCSLEKDLEAFPMNDLSIVGEKGIRLSGGQKARINLARAVYAEADFYLLDDPLSAVDALVGNELLKNCIGGYLFNKCVILVTNQLQYLESMDRIYLLKEGRIFFNGSYEQLKSSNNIFASYVKMASKEPLKNDDKLLDAKENNYENKDFKQQDKELIKTGSVETNVYKKYFTMGGPWYAYLCILLLFLGNQLCASLIDYFVTFWVNLQQYSIDNNTNEDSFLAKNYVQFKSIFTTHFCIMVYFFLTIILVIVTLGKFISFYQYCLSSSSKLHNKMFISISKAPMSFFYTNSSGRILNRFSQDISVIDESLPEIFLDTVEVGITITAVFIILIFINLLMIIPTVIIAILFYIYRNYFIKTSRNIKRIEATLRSPVFSHLNSSLQGLATIRAFNAEPILIDEFDRHQDSHSAAFYLFISCNRAFAVLLDFHCTLYVGLVAISTFWTSSLNGNVGLAITQAVALTGSIQRGIRQWNETENQMTSVERILEYSEIISETSAKTKPSKSWPEHGKIIFDSVTLSYGENQPMVLKDISFEVKPNQKIGIVGRTGAGKSSIISALFRLEDYEGTIVIDNVDIKTLSLESVRSKISIIPQDPFLFSGTLKKNLDPFDEYPEKVLWEALEKVQLKALVEDLHLELNYLISEGGINLSVGQRQLICLARALIRNNKILVIDEATANVDPHTDKLIQATIREKFKNCTVLTIAHRLHTIMDSDKIMVMENGKIVEYESPDILLQKQGVFYNLVTEAGDENIIHSKKSDEKV